jgi:hypothetical protein
MNQNRRRSNMVFATAEPEYEYVTDNPGETTKLVFQNEGSGGLWSSTVARARKPSCFHPGQCENSI